MAKVPQVRAVYVCVCYGVSLEVLAFGISALAECTCML